MKSLDSQQLQPDEYPVSEFYKASIVEGVTIKQTARNWVAALLIKDPKSGSESIRIYQWHRTTNEGDWKRRGIITLDKSDQVRDLSSALLRFAHTVANAQLVKLQNKTGSRAQKNLGHE